MSKSIQNPYYNEANKTNPLVPIVRQIDKEILIAYDCIVRGVRAMLINTNSLSKGKFLEFKYPWQLKPNYTTQEFVCEFCSVSIVLSRDEYLIKFVIGDAAFKKGRGVNSNALIRLGFKFTMESQTNLTIETCLDIQVTASPADYFKKRQEELEG